MPTTIERDLTREDVYWGYWYALGRPPEDEQAIQNALSYVSREQFRHALHSCEEFRGRHAVSAGYLPSSIPPLDVEWHTDLAIEHRLLEHVARTWNALGHERPHWSVLSSDQFLPDQLHAYRKQFYASGEQDSRDLIATLLRVGVQPGDVPEMFEFGCGVGRVTPHLARHFRTVTGCDISPSHMKLAEAALADAEVINARIVRAHIDDFGMKEAFDLWYSRIVLQHNSPPLIALVLRRAFKMLRPGGIAAFQLPTYATGYAFRIDDYLVRLDAQSGQIEMHLLPQPVVFAIAREAECTTLEVREDNGVGNPAWISNFFVFQKER